jgi:hypothetical protein
MRARDWLPGDLIVVLESSLITKWSDDENTLSEHFTRGLQLGLIINRSHRWAEPWAEPNTLLEGSHMYYLVFFANYHTGFYKVPGNRIIHPDEVNDPSRLFGSQRLSD